MTHAVHETRIHLFSACSRACTDTGQRNECIQQACEHTMSSSTDASVAPTVSRSSVDASTTSA